MIFLGERSEYHLVMGDSVWTFENTDIPKSTYLPFWIEDQWDFRGI